MCRPIPKCARPLPARRRAARPATTNREGRTSGTTAMLFAALDIADLLKLGLGLVVVIVALVNKISAKTQERAERATRPRPLPPPRAAERPRPDHEDIDQFLDEVLGRRGAGGPEQVARPLVP